MSAPRPKNAASARRTAASAQGRSALLVLALTLAILLAGGVGTYFAAQALVAPGDAVGQAGALPVYSAVGQKADAVNFLPWQVFEEVSPSSNESVSSGELVHEWGNLIEAFLSDGSTEKIDFSWPLDGTGPFYAFAAPSGQALFSCFRAVPFTVTFFPAQGVSREVPLLLDAALGTSNSSGTTECLVLQLRPAVQPSPTDESRNAARRTVLLDLYSLAGAEADFSEGSPAVNLPSSPCRLQALFPFLQDYLTSIGLPSACARVAAVMNDQSFPSVLAGSFGHARPPAQGTVPDEAALEQALQQAFAVWGIDFQLITLDSTVLVLFSDANFSGPASLGIYYDPALGCYSGFGVQ